MAEWRHPLTGATLGLLLFETITGLSIYLLPFSGFNQFGVLLHTVLGVRLGAGGVFASLSRTTGKAVPAAGADVAGLTSVLTRQVGDADVPLRFEDATAELGLSFRHFPAVRASLLLEDMGSGVACGDYDGDGYTDLFFVNFAGSVAPDATIDAERGRSRLFRNEGDGASPRFVDVAKEAGVDDLKGRSPSASWADRNNDGLPDLYVANDVSNNGVFLNAGDGTFRDIGASSMAADYRGAMGIAVADFDNDGRRDLWIVNDSTMEQADDHARLAPQNPLVMWNRGRGFVDVAAAALPSVARPIVGRGGAQLDLDRDGLMDLVFVVHGGAPIVLKNESQPAGHWLRVALRQAGGNTQALGARVCATCGAATQMAEVGASASYLSQDEPPLHFGLGGAQGVDVLRIAWPDGTEEVHRNLPADRAIEFTHAIAQGQGRRSCGRAAHGFLSCSINRSRGGRDERTQ